MTMNKRLATATAIAFASLFAVPAAHAASATGNFNVTVNLTSKCEVVSAANVDFTYTSFQAGPASATGGGMSIRCTNTLPYTVALDASTGTVAGLNYSLSLSANSGTGNGAAQGYTVSGTMAAGQGGTCASSTCAGTDARVLTVTY
jgi:spore coat protein U-like protein